MISQLPAGGQRKSHSLVLQARPLRDMSDRWQVGALAAQSASDEWAPLPGLPTLSFPLGTGETEAWGYS